jgi:hypothetical protein
MPLTDHEKTALSEAGRRGIEQTTPQPGPVIPFNATWMSMWSGVVAECSVQALVLAKSHADARADELKHALTIIREHLARQETRLQKLERDK